MGAAKLFQSGIPLLTDIDSILERISRLTSIDFITLSLEMECLTLFCLKPLILFLGIGWWNFVTGESTRRSFLNCLYCLIPLFGIDRRSLAKLVDRGTHELMLTNSSLLTSNPKGLIKSSLNTFIALTTLSLDWSN